MSFTWWGPLDGTPWYMAYESANLFGNYGDLFDDSKLWGSIGRTFLIVAVCVPIEFLLGLGLAILFAEKFVGKRLFYSIMLMPMMIVPAVAGYMFFMLFQSTGPINDLLSRISGSEVEILWLADGTLAMISVMIADIWQWTPLMFLILLAGMVGVPEDQMKAATLLGANAWQRFWRIVLPRMKMVMIIAAGHPHHRVHQDLRCSLRNDRRRAGRGHQVDLPSTSSTPHSRTSIGPTWRHSACSS